MSLSFERNALSHSSQPCERPGPVSHIEPTRLTCEPIVGRAFGPHHAPAQGKNTSRNKAARRYGFCSHLSVANMTAHSTAPSSQSSQVSDTA